MAYQPRIALPSGAFAILTAFTLAAVVPAFLLSSTDSLHLTLPAAAVYGNLVYISVRLGMIAASGEEKIVRLTFWVFAYVFLGICPLLQIALRTFPLSGQYDDRLLFQAAFVVLAGLLAFDLGQRFLSSGLGSVAVPRFLRRPLRKSTIMFVGPAALLLSLLLLQRLGGWESLILPRVQRDELLADEFGSAELLLLKNLARAPTYAVLMAALTVWVCSRRNLSIVVGLGWKAMCLVLLAATLLINNPISAPRLAVGTIMLSLFFVLPWKRWYAALCVGGLIVGFIFVFPLADVFRVSLDASLAEQWNATSAARELAQKMDFDSYQQIANTLLFVSREGLQFGQQIGGAFLFWVPRFLWRDKPLATGQLVGEEAGYPMTNLSAPLWTELYIDGGVLLVVLGFMAYGIAVRTLDEWNQWSKSQGDARVISVLVPIFAGYQFFLLRGSLMPAIAYLAPIVIFAALCSLRLGLRKRGLTRLMRNQ